MAFIFGLIAARLNLPLILGYLLAGIVAGPFTPGFVADVGLAQQLSEIGVTLLMFGVGLHFSVKDLLAVRKIAVPGAVVQIATATALGAIMAHFWGWQWGAGLVFGLCLSVASTVVLIRAMTERGLIESINGRIAVGWLIVEDLATVVALVVLPAVSVSLGGIAPEGVAEGNIGMTLLTTLGKVGAFVVVMLVAGKHLIPRLLGRVARTGSRELFTIGVLATALGIAFGSAALFNVSPAIGAFFAGVIISESDLSYQAGAEMLPLQEAFTVLFFVAVGMLFDPGVLTEHPWHILLTLGIVMVGKSVAALAIVLWYRYPFATALTIAASLAQIGEFSFILIGLGMSLKLVPAEALSIILAVAILSISFNPLIFRTIDPIDKFVKKHRWLLKLLEARLRKDDLETGATSPRLRDHIVMVGFGRVGTTIARSLKSQKIPFVVVDQDRTIIDELRKQGIPAIFGDATRPGIMSHAGLKSARLLIVATPAKSQVREIVNFAHKMNPRIISCVRTHSFADAVAFEAMGIERVVLGELELGLQMADFALSTYNDSHEEVEKTIAEIRSLGSLALARKSDDQESTV